MQLVINTFRASVAARFQRAEGLRLRCKVWLSDEGRKTAINLFESRLEETWKHPVENKRCQDPFKKGPDTFSLFLTRELRDQVKAEARKLLQEDEP